MKPVKRILATLLLPRIERSSGRVVGLALPTAYLLLPFVALAILFWPGGCASTPVDVVPRRPGPSMRVRLLAAQTQVSITASRPPVCHTSIDTRQRTLNARPDTPYDVSLAADGWRIGRAALSAGTLVLLPDGPATVSINGRTYRGQYHFVPVGQGKFDVVNHVEIDDYLKGVLRSELFPGWHENTYKAQAIAARTYALFEHYRAQTNGRYWDVHDDQRSQVYGGVAAETDKAIRAVDATAGIVLVHGPGDGKLIKAYFSSCCGGVSQSVTHAGFEEPYIPPLGARDNHGLCRISNRFTWGPIVIRKDELTRRFRAWGQKTGRAEKDIRLITRIDVQEACLERPVRFRVTDSNGEVYSLIGEYLRQAVNTTAAEGTTLYSSFVKTINESDTIRFVDGHGFGHGVGMCQWCSEARARAGVSAEDIVLAGYPGARLTGAY